MAMADRGNRRREALVTAITAELDRQARDGSQRVDIPALAGAVELALEPPEAPAEGRHPDELNATNDD